jgi:hypothetical protein
MSKINSNQPCICGSGKKHKKCCGTVPGESMQKPSSPSVEGTWGVSGAGIFLSLRPYYEEEDDPRNFLDPGGAEGTYKVSFLLCKPSRTILDDNHVVLEAEKESGDSHLFIGGPNLRAEINADLPHGKFIFYGYPNKNGCLSLIEIEEVQAPDFGAALEISHSALSPVLSRLSLLLDIPLNIYRTTIKELASHSFMTSLSIPYTNKPSVAFDNYPPDKEFSKFASLYREALNSNSSNYQYLCFYKIIEGN